MEFNVYGAANEDFMKINIYLMADIYGWALHFLPLWMHPWTVPQIYSLFKTASLINSSKVHSAPNQKSGVYGTTTSEILPESTLNG